MTGEERPSKQGAEYVYDALLEAGVEVLIGLPGTQTLPLDHVVAKRNGIRYVMAKHETAIPHIAWGYFEAGGSVAATVTVPGPGDTNAMHGLKNALEDCVPLIHVSAVPDPDERGKTPIHEIESHTFDTVVKKNLHVDRPVELTGTLASGFETALTPPMGPVRIGVPKGVLADTFTAPTATVSPERFEFETDESVAKAVSLLATAERPVLYVGGGTRRSPAGPRVVNDLVAELDAPVATTYKGKGVVAEDDPHWLGVTGSHFPTGSRRVLETADVVLALGTDFDGVSTDHWTLPMGDSLIHVDVDPGSIDVAYDADVPVLADVGVAGERILQGLQATASAPSWDGAGIGEAVRSEYKQVVSNLGSGDQGPLHTPAVLEAIREETPREVTVTTDVGGFRLWALQHFEAYEPERFITAGSWAGMGIGLPAAMGAALARPEDPVLALHGDGGLMMCLQELHTAVENDLDVTVVVANNGDYGIVSKSPEFAEEAPGHRFSWDRPSFSSIAAGFGCRGTSVETIPDLRRAIHEALDRNGPDLIEVAISSEEPSAVAAAKYESTVQLA